MTPVGSEITAAENLVEVLLATASPTCSACRAKAIWPYWTRWRTSAIASEVVTCRHEAGAANMAVAHGKLTGRPGVCMVTRGPGATHAAIGVHTAKQDSRR